MKIWLLMIDEYPLIHLTQLDIILGRTYRFKQLGQDYL